MISTSSYLKTKIDFLKGVGEKRAELLRDELGVKTFFDLINLYPFRYIDRTQFHNISTSQDGDTAQLKGTIVEKEKVKGRNNRYRLTALFKDSSGFVELIWFQSVKWLEESIKIGEEYIVFGKVNVFKGKKSIPHPELELASKMSAPKALEPVYSSTEKLNAFSLDNRNRRKLAQTVISKISQEDLPENLSEKVISQLKLCSRFQSYQWIHFPPSDLALKSAQNRIKFEEVLFLQLRLLQIRKKRELDLAGFSFEKVGSYFNSFFKEKLPFELTDAQKRVLKEIRADLKRGAQMNRLLQGDVGSGKTIVALMSMFIALDNGYQACMMAPTEILAQQHYAFISESVKGLGVQVAFLSGSVKGKTRAQLLQFLKEGHIDILVGTHALIEDPVVFKKLGLAVIDEQHRFGVIQRAKLWNKNDDYPPHVLVMTATPIPRTLAMTVYGDLDVSIIDELPPGRKEIETVHRFEKDRTRIVGFMHEEIKKGRQIYIVYPLIEESEKLDLQNLQEGYEQLLPYFPAPDFQIAVVHGRMKHADKDLEMQRFVSGKAQIMVATTVIEVGVNVPNASVMIIENAERFGLSQLHQLRGRVGRGAERSFCILMTSFKLTKEGKKRIETMCRTNNGFEISEVDMELRGAGNIEGTQQSGSIEFNLLDLFQDRNILITARHLADSILEDDPLLEKEENHPIAEYLAMYRAKYRDWGRIS
ncbi:MAG: ATP-dependent DNA helicase RecG [Saprospiraceae bacterium]|nr:ATP-dependent DNA helicase RecG [Saprospiraceae bacterium]